MHEAATVRQPLAAAAPVYVGRFVGAARDSRHLDRGDDERAIDLHEALGFEPIAELAEGIAEGLADAWRYSAWRWIVAAKA